MWENPPWDRQGHNSIYMLLFVYYILLCAIIYYYRSQNIIYWEFLKQQSVDATRLTKAHFLMLQSWFAASRELICSPFWTSAAVVADESIPRLVGK